MKKIILLSSLLCTLFSGAQILNPGFESVTAGKPDSWNLGFYSTYYIKDTSDAYSGNHAAFIKAFGAQSYSVQGAVLGFFATSGKPAALTGWYKCSLQPGDSLVFSPYVYQTTALSPKAQAYAFTTTSTAVYKQFTAPINYANFLSSTVDTLFVSIYLSGPTTDAESVFVPQAGTWAMMDELSLTTNTVATGIITTGEVVNVEKVYPQPATDVANVIYTVAQTANCNLQLFDVTGKEVRSFLTDEKQAPGRYKAELNLEGLTSGIYFVKLSTGSETRMAKLMKQ